MKTKIFRNHDIWIAAAGLVVALNCLMMVSPATAQEMERETYNANAMALGAVGGGQTASLTITIDRWTSAEERQKLIQTLAEKGMQAMHQAMTQQEGVGGVRLRGETRQVLRYAWNTQVGEKRVITLATDRTISFGELVENPITRDYNFTIIDLEINEEGRGTGQAFHGAKVLIDEKTNRLVIKDFDTRPIRLRGVRRINN